MKLTVILLTTGFLNVCATGLSQNVSFSGKDVPLETVFFAVKKQTGFVFLYSQRALANTKPVSIKASNLPLSAFLDLVFKDQPIKYTIRSKSIFITPRSSDRIQEDRRELPGTSESAIVPIRGRVLDEDGKPLAGASITVKGNKSSGVTDAEGMFTVDAHEGDIVFISYVGFGKIGIKITSATTAIVVSAPGTEDNGTARSIATVGQSLSAGANGFVITLSRTNSALNEVVVNKGYYTESKKLSTGSVASVSAREIGKQPVNNPLLALKGRMAGVDIAQGSGIAGGPVSIRIRGTNSLRADGSEPLYVINGVPFSAATLSSNAVGIALSPSSPIAGFSPLSPLTSNRASPLANINPADIESIDVLKDGDATAIYGSRGANGVVLITTKKGKTGETKVDFRYTHSWAQVPRFAKLLNTQQFLDMRKEAYKNDNIALPTVPAYGNYDLTVYDQNRYTDWQKELIGGTANNDHFSATLSGGSKTTTFLLSATYNKEGNVFPGHFSFQRGSGNLNLHHVSPNNRLKATLTVNYNYGENNLPSNDLTAQTISLVPNAPAGYDDQGKLNFQNGTFTNNPYIPLHQPYKGVSRTLITNLQLSYQLFPGLDIRLNTGYNDNSMKETFKRYARNAPSPATATDAALLNNAQMNSWVIEPKLDLTRKAGPGTLKALVGTSFQKEVMEGGSFYAEGYASEALVGNLAAAARITTFGAPFYEYRYSAVFGLLNYSIGNKYILSVTGNRNASSRFGPGKQVADFYSVAGAWVFSEERFMKDNRIVSFGKLRLSYGITGNDQIGNYSYLDSYNATGASYNGIATLTPARLANPDFSWETTRKLNAALELGILNDRVSLVAEYYRGISTNQLVGYQLPTITGFASIQYNLPAKVQNTSWELTVNSINIQLPKFSWRSGFTLTIPKNKLLEFPDLAASTYNTTFAVGEPLTVQMRLQYLGVDPQTGVYKFFDANKNGNDLDYPGDLSVFKFLGRRYYGGFSNEFRYKNLDMSFLFQYVKQNNFSHLHVTNGAPGSGFSNQVTEVLKRWRNPGDITGVQKFTTAGPAYTRFSYLYQVSDQSITDASYIRLQNLAIGYNFNPASFRKAGIRSMRVFALGQNLLTFTHFKGADPEVVSGASLPALRVIAAGVEIGF